ncbi:MAG: type II toxin-antitoxin system HicB family antitoxin [Holosporales bacterium]|jgi:predicted RNase H-like HicB family nuclease|nr:type II toxin-antitoxin system HicB family antitoxin [Holosporales bacterium]
MKYAYLAVFSPNNEEGYNVHVPDLPGCRSYGKNLADAIFMAEEATAMWLWHAELKSEPIPHPSESLTVKSPMFSSYICADTNEYRKKHCNQAVKKTLSIPSWLNTQAEQSGINFSQLLKDAIKEKLNIF